MQSVEKIGNVKTKSAIRMIVIFFITTFVFTILLAIVQEGLSIDYRHIVLPQWGPGLAAILLSLTLYKNTLKSGLDLKKLSILQILLCLLIPFMLLASSFMIFNLVITPVSSINTLDFTFISVVLPATFFGAIGEALGWRVFLQKTLNQRFNPLVSSVIVGLLWGLWHVGHYSNGLVFMIAFLAFTISFSFVLAYSVNKYDYNLLLSSLFHFSANIGFFLFFSSLTTSKEMILITALVWILTSIILVPFYLRKKYSV
ncbi:MAG: CPBP family intramembrane glutamic endopeptidase [Candidatus Izemoplasmataceae bacterium]